MLVGQQLGPFIIDKELGAGAMGAVYRGRYLKTGQLVAIKVMAPGLDAVKSNASARFEREAEILKQFNHRNIVRLFGVGKHQGMRYFAMEYIEGESLDRVMARRNRMTWEEVVDLGQQLCAALQHAHEQGIIHRDLKPSNIMVLPDGTVKLADFGIAKDVDCTQITSANCTVGTAAYMAPEQCKGERDLTHKSDLYSMGVVFYELITGKRPFEAENSVEMFLLHVNGTFERPSRLALEMPVWLDTLICQLLEKKPDQRPRDASAVAVALAGIREKVEAQQSAGVDAVRSRLIDRPPGARRPDKEDREAARTLLLGGKVKGRRKRGKKAWYEQIWARAAGIAILLLAVGLLLFVALRPASPEILYREAERLMASQKPEDWEKARGGPIKEYLARYGKRAGTQTEQMRQWNDDLAVAEYEGKLRKHLEKKAAKLPYPPQNKTEEIAFQAAEDEEAGELEKARTAWSELLQQEGQRGWGRLAERRLQQMDTLPNWTKELEKTLKKVRFGQEPQQSGLEEQAFLAWRYERFGDRLMACQRFKALRAEAARESGQHVWYLFAAQHYHDLEKSLSDHPQTDKDRKELISRKLDQARTLLEEKGNDTRLLDIQATCLNVLALYGKAADKDEELKELVERAAALLKDVRTHQGKTS